MWCDVWYRAGAEEVGDKAPPKIKNRLGQSHPPATRATAAGQDTLTILRAAAC
jgi:hypothetical protein